MKGGRRSYEEQTRTKLLDLWKGDEAFGQPLGCVTTTFTFDAELFEEQCLARFLSVQGNSNESARAYLLEREEKLSQCFACALVDQQHVAPDRSLRWNLLPIWVPGGGVQHAKLTLLAWENCVRAVVGSANLSEPGYRKNQEMVAVLDFSKDSGLPGSLLEGCVAFLRRVARLTPGSAQKEDGPHKTLDEFLRMISKRATVIPTAAPAEAHCELVALIPDAEQRKLSVLDQLKAMWHGSAPNDAWILSPFFDEEGRAAETARGLADILTTRGGRRITFLSRGRKTPDGTIQIDAPDALKKTSHPSLEHGFGYVSEDVPIEKDRVLRPLHAKAIWLGRDDTVLHMLGSSNFTAAGLGLHPNHNIELNVAYLLRSANTALGRMHEKSWPAFEPVEDPDDAQFLGGAVHSEPDGAKGEGLPYAFGQALYRGPKAEARLELEISSKAPRKFQVRSRTAEIVIDSEIWRGAGEPTLVHVPWRDARPPSALEVQWEDEDEQTRKGFWIVNAADASALPSPEELADLTLDELLEVLTSARPMHEMVSRILDRRDQRSAQGAEAEIDPHRKVDTSNFLLRRMRRLAHALEGLRERLEQPVSSVDALRWRLRGPLGVLALAERLAKEEGGGASFMITEVAVTLRNVAWRAIGDLNTQRITLEVKAVVEELRQTAQSQKSTPALVDYVREAFQELAQ